MMTLTRAKCSPQFRIVDENVNEDTGRSYCFTVRTACNPMFAWRMADLRMERGSSDSSYVRASSPESFIRLTEAARLLVEAARSRRPVPAFDSIPF